MFRTSCRLALAVGGAVCVVFAAVTAAVTAHAATTDELVREVAQRTYIHGITEDIAERDLPPGAVPVLLELLEDRSFPRPDNVVAFLAHLGGRETTPRLLSFLSRSGRPLTAAEDRARLVAPQALGRIAARGDAAALNALFEMVEPGRGRAPRRPAEADIRAMAQRGLAWSETEAARRFLAARAPADPAARQALELHEHLRTRSAPRRPSAVPQAAPRFDGSLPDDAVSATAADAAARSTAPAAPVPAPGFGAAFDTAATVVDHGLSFANHAEVWFPVGDIFADDLLHEATIAAARPEFTQDVGCCAQVRRSGASRSFGAAGDGRAMIDDEAEGIAVLSDPVARIKVVRAINWCGAPGFNIIGCGYTPGWGLAVVRFDYGEELLWIHEYGHNLGLEHNSNYRYIMYPHLDTMATGLTASECARFHTPHAYARAETTDAGACTDTDGDGVNGVTDNCPNVANSGLEDRDGDDRGDVCDNCLYVPNDQLNGDTDAYGDACDNCPAVSNADQRDIDLDKRGDACDPCPNDGWNDDDLDGICGFLDKCPFEFDPLQDDGDHDGWGDVCDECPADAANDQDADGYCAGEDNCPAAYNPRSERHVPATTFAGAGDVNADGFDDAIVGEPGSDVGAYDGGAAHLYLGSAAGLAAEPSLTISGTKMYGAFGQTVAAAGDVNRDGFADVLVADATSLVQLYLGTNCRGRVPARPGGRLPRPVAEPRCAGLRFAPAWQAPPPASGTYRAVAGNGDLNGDGYDDVVLGALQEGTGRVHVYFGSRAGLAARPDRILEPPGGGFTRFGVTAVLAGDLNGDGYDDLAVGAETKNAAGWPERVCVYLGGPAGPSSAIEISSGRREVVEFGKALARAGDTDGDGYDDLLVGAPSLGGRTPAGGAVYLYRGHAGGPSTAPDWTRRYRRTRAYARFGAVAAGAGDLDGDGYDDLLVGAPGEAFAYVFLGGPAGTGASDGAGASDGPDADAAWRGAPPNTWGSYAGRLEGVGDIDGDGRPEIMVGETRGSGDVAYIYDGGPGGIEHAQADADGDGLGDACDATP